MKLSMLIFVLITIIYSCQCAPTPDWVADFQRDMQKMTQDMRQNQQQMDRTFKAIGQQLQNSQKNLEKQLKQISKVAYNGTNGIQDLNGITYIVSGSSTSSTSQYVNGHRVDKTIIQNVINNVRYVTIIEYDSTTNKTTITKYECSLSPNLNCELKSNEVSDGPPGRFN